MRKTLKITIVSAITLLGLLFIYGVGYWISSQMELRSLSKLKIEESPTRHLSNYIPSTNEIFGWVEDLTKLGRRMPGTEAGTKASEYVAAKFRSFGMENVEFVEAETVLWTANEWSLEVGGTLIPSYFMTYSFDTGDFGPFSTPATGLKAELVYVGKGSDSDFKNIDVKGKIVVAEVHFSEVPVGLARLDSFLYYDPDNTLPLSSSRINPYSPNTYPYSYYRAMKGGAKAYVGILWNYLDSNRYNNEDYSYVDGPLKIPGLWVSKNDGKKIIDLVKSKAGSIEASLELSGSRNKVMGRSVEAFLPGQSEETILIHSHHDSSTTGAVEDASGTSMVLALARFYSRIPLKDRKKSLLFTTMDTHFTGYQVHDVFLDKQTSLKRNIIVDICLEHIAKEVQVIDNKTGKCQRSCRLIGGTTNEIRSRKKRADFEKITESRRTYGQICV